MPLIVIVLLAGVWRFTGFMKVGDLGPIESTRVKMAQRESFTPEAWRAADPKKRGLMLADLAQKHRFYGVPGDSIRALLGPGSCYYVQDGFPCYRVELDGKPYELRMTLRQGYEAEQPVIDVDLDPAPDFRR